MGKPAAAGAQVCASGTRGPGSPCRSQEMAHPRASVRPFSSDLPVADRQCHRTHSQNLLFTGLQSVGVSAGRRRDGHSHGAAEGVWL